MNLTALIIMNYIIKMENEIKEPYKYENLPLKMLGNKYSKEIQKNILFTN